MRIEVLCDMCAFSYLNQLVKYNFVRLKAREKLPEKQNSLIDFIPMTKNCTKKHYKQKLFPARSKL